MIIIIYSLFKPGNRARLAAASWPWRGRVSEGQGVEKLRADEERSMAAKTGRRLQFSRRRERRGEGGK